MKPLFKALLAGTLLSLAAAPAIAETQVRIVSGQEKQNGDILKDIFSAFDAASADVAVDLQMDNKSDIETTQKVLADIVAGSPPDAVRVTGAVFATFVNSGRAQPLDACIDGQPELKAQLDAGLLDSFRGPDGKLYAMPFYTTLPALYINVAAFKAAGLDPANPPANWTALREAAAKLSDADKGKFGVLMYMPNTYLFGSQMESAGGHWVDAEGKPTADNPATVKTFAFMREMVEKKYMPAIAPSAFWGEFAALFRSGDLGMMVFSASSYPGLTKGLGFETTLAPMPIADDGSVVATASGNGFVMLATDPEKQKATCAALSALVSPENVARIVKATATVPHNTAAVDKPDLLGDYFAQNPAFKAVNAQKAGIWYAMPGRANTEFHNVFGDIQFSVLNGSVSPEQGAADLNARMKELLADN